VADKERRNGLSWCRLWADVLDSPRVGRLTDRTFRVWILMLAYCARQGFGEMIPDSPTDVAWAMRLPEADVVAAFNELAAAGLIQDAGEGMSISGWKERNPLSDCDPTGAERQKRYRETRAKLDGVTRYVTDASRVTSRTSNGRVTGSDADAEKTQTQTPVCNLAPSAGGAIPVPPTVAHTPPEPSGKPIPKTDADLKPIFEAYCRGSGQRLTWRMQVVYPTEQIARFGLPPARVELAARTYAKGMTGGIAPSYPRFAQDFDRWNAEVDRRPVDETPGKHRRAGTTGGTFTRAGPQDPKLGAPSAARAMHGWCKTHPGRAAVSAAGLCGECRDSMTRQEAVSA